MCLVKIHVLDSAVKGNDYRGEKRGLATLHTSVSWGMEILAFLLFFFFSCERVVSYYYYPLVTL